MDYRKLLPEAPRRIADYVLWTGARMLAIFAGVLEILNRLRLAGPS
ncbi:MAG: hypothetical protein ABSA09_04970 [Desulfobaccales bacterium]